MLNINTCHIKIYLYVDYRFYIQITFYAYKYLPELNVQVCTTYYAICLNVKPY